MFSSRTTVLSSKTLRYDRTLAIFFQGFFQATLRYDRTLANFFQGFFQATLRYDRTLAIFSEVLGSAHSGLR